MSHRLAAPLFELALAVTLALGATLPAWAQKVKLTTSAGDIVVELDATKAPKSVANFVQYVKAGHYNGTVFHRVIDGFMIQGGGMNAELSEKPTRAPIPLEAGNGLSNARGTLAQMAAAMGLTLPRNRLASTDAAMPPVTIAAREASVDMLAAGIQDIADALASESVPLSALLHMVLETIYRALACQRVVFCLRDASGQRLTGRFGLGDQAKLLSPRFDIPLRTVSGQPPDALAIGQSPGRVT